MRSIQHTRRMDLIRQNPRNANSMDGAFGVYKITSGETISKFHEINPQRGDKYKAVTLEILGLNRAII